MKIKIEKINELESLGFRKMRPYCGEINYKYVFGNAHLRVNSETGIILIDSNTQYGLYKIDIPDILITLIEKDFIER